MAARPIADLNSVRCTVRCAGDVGGYERPLPDRAIERAYDGGVGRYVELGCAAERRGAVLRLVELDYVAAEIVYEYHVADWERASRIEFYGLAGF